MRPVRYHIAMFKILVLVFCIVVVTVSFMASAVCVVQGATADPAAVMVTFPSTHQWANRRPDGAELRIVDFEITERGCPTVALFERESEDRDALVAARYATFDESRLIIATATGRVLIFGQ